MKKVFLWITFLFSFLTTYAQTVEITYEKINRINLPDHPQLTSQIKEQILKQLSAPVYYELIYSQGESVFRKKPSVAAEQEQNSGQVRISSRKLIIYKNHKTGEYLKQTNFLSRIFLITDTLEKLPWQITGEIDTIGGYKVRKAVLKKGNSVIKAWFTEEFPIPEGPFDYYGLPGLILKLETDQMIVQAVNIKVSPENRTIEKPSAGKKVTREAFEEIRRKKLRELGIDGGNGRVQIRILGQ